MILWEQQTGEKMSKTRPVFSKIRINHVSKDFIVVSDLGQGDSRYQTVEHDADNIYRYLDGYCKFGVGSRSLYALDQNGEVKKIIREENKIVCTDANTSDKKFVTDFMKMNSSLFPDAL